MFKFEILEEIVELFNNKDVVNDVDDKLYYDGCYLELLINSEILSVVSKLDELYVFFKFEKIEKS